MMLPSREEGGAVADLLMVRRQQQGMDLADVFNASDLRCRVR